MTNPRRELCLPLLIVLCVPLGYLIGWLLVLGTHWIARHT